MKSNGKHRASGAAPRNGAAALMIGGLVAGTVATAGATTLNKETPSETAAPTVTSQTSAARTTSDQAAEGAIALASLRSASLSELRDETAADRSQARSAPADAASVSTVLAGSAFTGTTVEVEEVVVEQAPEAAASAEQAAPTQEQATPVEQAAPAQQQAAPVQQQAAPVQQAAVQQQAAPVQQAAPAPVGGGIVGIAQQYVGYPYVLGGNPPSTFDCSSFTWWVFQQAGIDIPRSVSGQKAAVTPVSNPQPGDLVFTNSFYHVGIYAGNGMVIEALNASSGVTYGAPVYGGIWYGRING